MAIETTEWNTKDTLGKTLEGLEASKSQESNGLEGDKLVLNMGPSHPSTHGVLRIILELDGEVITKAIPDVGYLHRGDEKIAVSYTHLTLPTKRIV